MEQSEKPILSVTEISLSLKSCIEQIFGDIRVRGEVVGVKRAPSGHTYFSLKDNDSVLSAICWRGRDKITTDSLQDGLEIICYGKLSTYPGRSNYQMIVDRAELAGLGAFLKLLNEKIRRIFSVILHFPFSILHFQACSLCKQARCSSFKSNNTGTAHFDDTVVVHKLNKCINL